MDSCIQAPLVPGTGPMMLAVLTSPTDVTALLEPSPPAAFLLPLRFLEIGAAMPAFAISRPPPLAVVLPAAAAADLFRRRRDECRCTLENGLVPLTSVLGVGGTKLVLNINGLKGRVLRGFPSQFLVSFSTFFFFLPPPLVAVVLAFVLVVAVTAAVAPAGCCRACCCGGFLLLLLLRFLSTALAITARLLAGPSSFLSERAADAPPPPPSSLSLRFPTAAFFLVCFLGNRGDRSLFCAVGSRLSLAATFCVTFFLLGPARQSFGWGPLRGADDVEAAPPFGFRSLESLLVLSLLLDEAATGSWSALDLAASVVIIFDDDESTASSRSMRRSSCRLSWMVRRAATAVDRDDRLLPPADADGAIVDWEL